MAGTVRGCPTAQLQPEGTEEPQTNTSVPQQERQADATEGKVIADYKLDVDYKSEGQTSQLLKKKRKAPMQNMEK